MTKPDASIISVKNVSKTFGTFKAVDSINLDVQQGEIFGFLGPNGAGKSTTIRLILDILRADSGSITIFGNSNLKVRDVHKEIGYLSGEMVLDNDLTGKQYLRFIGAQFGGKFDGDIVRLADLLEANLDKKIGDYSRGNRQKIGLIAALLHKPKLLILDEPTSGFDPLVQEKFADLMRSYVAVGGTVFMSSHVLAEVQHLCDRVAFIKAGKIATVTSVHELLDSTVKRVNVTADAADITRIRGDYQKVSGLTLVEAGKFNLGLTFSGDINTLLRFFASKKVSDISIREPELDEIFGHFYESVATSPTDTSTPKPTPIIEESDHA